MNKTLNSCSYPSCLFFLPSGFREYKRIKRKAYSNMNKHKTKKQLRNSAAAFLTWTSLGLNQGPPDYESVALTN